MKKIKYGLAALIMGLISVLFGGTLPAEAAAGKTSKICNHTLSWTYITAKDIATGASNNLTTHDGNGDYLGECTDYHNAADWRVHTDPMGASHSYRTRYDKYIGGAWQIGSWNACHENSDNPSSNPADPTDGTPWRVVYRNYDLGYCNNW